MGKIFPEFEAPPGPIRGRIVVSLPLVMVAMCLLLAAGAAVVLRIQRPNKPIHMILVVLDTVRADHLTPYGYERDTTPNLALLAKESLLFERARSASPWTLPSHASMFTGKLPSEHGCHWEHRYLVDSSRTVAEDLLDRGVETIGITSNVNASSLYHLDQGFETFRETWRLRSQYSGKDDSRIVNAEVEKFLDNRDPQRPFFLFLNYMDAHLPYVPEPPFDRMFGAVDGRVRELASRPALLEDVLTGAVRLDEGLRDGLTRLYDGSLRQLDERLLELLTLLERRGLDEHTMLVVTSDHGELLGEDGLVDHQLSIREEVLRVPLLVRFPGRIRPGRVEHPVSLTQLSEWFWEAAAGRTPEWIPPPEFEPPAHFAEYRRPVDVLQAMREAGVDPAAHDRRLWVAWPVQRTPNLKGWLDDRGGAALYDLGSFGEGEDRREHHLSAWESLEPLLDGLRRTRFVEGVGDLSPGGRVPSPEDQQRLAELGYLRTPPAEARSVHAGEHHGAARRAAQAGNLGVALEELERALRMAPDHLGILWDRALIADQAGHEETASFYASYIRAAEAAGQGNISYVQRARARQEELQRR